MRAFHSYKAFCSYEYAWLLFGAAPLGMLVVCLLMRLLWAASESAYYTLGAFLPIGVILLEAFSDSILFAGFGGAKVYGVHLLQGSPMGGVIVREACVLDMVRRFFYAAVVILLARVAAGQRWEEFFWGSPERPLANVLMMAASIVGLYAFSQLAVLLARFFPGRASYMILGFLCVFPYLGMKLLAVGYSALMFSLGMVLAVSVSIFTVFDMERKMRRSYE